MFMCIITTARCGGVIRSTSGIITSPEYPNKYVYDTECRWEIETQPKFKIQISFEDLDLPINKTKTVKADLSYVTPREFSK